MCCPCVLAASGERDAAVSMFLDEYHRHGEFREEDAAAVSTSFDEDSQAEQEEHGEEDPTSDDRESDENDTGDANAQDALAYFSFFSRSRRCRTDLIL